MRRSPPPNARSSRRPLSAFDAETGSVVVDALYGAGLSKPLSGDAARAVDIVTTLNLPVVAVDLPSGVSGDSGDILGQAFRADITVTFARKKPGHLLLPGRERAARSCVADIGIGDDDHRAARRSQTFENMPALWLRDVSRAGGRCAQIQARPCRRLFRRAVGDGRGAAVGAGRGQKRGRGGDRAVAGECHAGERRAPDLDHAAQGRYGRGRARFLGDRRPSSLRPRSRASESVTRPRDFALAVARRRTTGTASNGRGSTGWCSMPTASPHFAMQPDTLFEAARRPAAPGAGDDAA